jgi:Flp pilus assembly protein TadG
MLRLVASTRAVVALEFAILAPLMAAMIGGVVEVGALLRAYSAMHRMTMQFAVSYADCPDTTQTVGATPGSCGTEANEYTSTSTIANFAPQLTAANVSLSMVQVQFSGATPSVTYPVGGTLTAAQSAALTTLYASVPATYTGTTNAVVVTGSYRYALLAFGTLMAPIIGPSFTISYTVAQLKT